MIDQMKMVLTVMEINQDEVANNLTEMDHATLADVLHQDQAMAIEIKTDTDQELMTVAQVQDTTDQMMIMDRKMVNAEINLVVVHSLAVNMIVMETDTGREIVSQETLMIELAQVIGIVTRTDTDQELVIEEEPIHMVDMTTIEAINREEDRTQIAIMVDRLIEATDSDLAQILKIMIGP